MSKRLTLRVTVPDEYDDVHPELIVEDLRIREGFDVEILSEQEASDE